MENLSQQPLAEVSLRRSTTERTVGSCVGKCEVHDTFFYFLPSDSPAAKRPSAATIFQRRVSPNDDRSPRANVRMLGSERRIRNLVEYSASTAWFRQSAWVGIPLRNKLGVARARWALKFYKTPASKRMPFQISSSFSVV